MTKNPNVFFSKSYASLKWLAIAGKYIYFQRTAANNHHAVPFDKPVIFASNHPNAFMDAVMIASYIPKGQTSFLVRADVFKPGFPDYALRSLKMLPVYRGRDNVDIQAKNDEIFSICFDRLAAKDPMIIFVEGSHSQVRRQRPVKKGISRIAFGAEMQHQFELDVHVVPVGLYYSKYTRPGGDLHVSYGDPIPVRKYLDLFQEHPAKAQLQLKNEIEASLQQQVLDIQSEAHYKSIDAARHIAVKEILEFAGYPEAKNLANEIASQKLMVNAMNKWVEANPDKADEWHNTVMSYKKQLDSHAIRDHTVSRPKSGLEMFFLAVLLLITAPIVAFGMFHNVLPWLLVDTLVERKIRDKHFQASIRYGVSIVLFPLFWLTIVLIPALIFIRPMYWAPIYLLAVICSGLITVWWIRQLKKWWANLRFNLFKKRKAESYQRLLRKRDKIISGIKAAMSALN